MFFILDGIVNYTIHNITNCGIEYKDQSTKPKKGDVLSNPSMFTRFNEIYPSKDKDVKSDASQDWDTTPLLDLSQISASLKRSTEKKKAADAAFNRYQCCCLQITLINSITPVISAACGGRHPDGSFRRSGRRYPSCA